MRALTLALLLFSTLLGREVAELQAKLIEAGKPYNLSLTLLAIAKVESNFGEVKVNIQDPSAGVMMIHVKHFITKHNIKDTNLNRNKVAQLLIDNDDLSIAEAVSILEFWKSKYCGRWGCSKQQWLQVWASYNCGYRINTPKCERYALKIQKTIAKFKSKD